MKRSWISKGLILIAPFAAVGLVWGYSIGGISVMVASGWKIPPIWLFGCCAIIPAGTWITSVPP